MNSAGSKGFYTPSSVPTSKLDTASNAPLSLTISSQDASRNSHTASPDDGEVGDDGTRNSYGIWAAKTKLLLVDLDLWNHIKGHNSSAPVKKKSGGSNK